jgi:hypothetical protein
MAATAVRIEIPRREDNPETRDEEIRSLAFKLLQRACSETPPRGAAEWISAEECILLPH